MLIHFDKLCLSWISNPRFSVYGHSLLVAIQLLDQGVPYTMGIPWCHLEASNQPTGNDQTLTISNLWGHCALNIVTVWMDYM